MRHIKTFNELNENFNNSKVGETLKKEFDKPTEPKKPFKRKLTEEESQVMLHNFKNHSWSNYVDATGKIVLGGGEGSLGKYYITEDDLQKLATK